MVHLSITLLTGQFRFLIHPLAAFRIPLLPSNPHQCVRLHHFPVRLLSGHALRKKRLRRGPRHHLRRGLLHRGHHRGHVRHHHHPHGARPMKILPDTNAAAWRLFCHIKRVLSTRAGKLRCNFKRCVIGLFIFEEERKAFSSPSFPSFYVRKSLRT